MEHLSEAGLMVTGQSPAQSGSWRPRLDRDVAIHSRRDGRIDSTLGPLFTLPEYGRSAAGRPPSQVRRVSSPPSVCPAGPEPVAAASANSAVIVICSGPAPGGFQ